MERAHLLVIAVVIAALALFGLRFMSSDSPEEVELAALSDRARTGSDSEGRLGVRPRLGGGGAGGAEGGRLGAGPGGGPRGSFGSGRAGSADLAAGGGRGLGGGLGVSGSGRIGSAGSGAAIGGIAAPDSSRKADLVDSLGSRPPTQSDLEQAPPPDNPEDIALKLDTTDDIADQQGREQDIAKPDDTDDGLKISEQGRIEFPNGGGVRGEAGEISFKIKPEWAGSDQTDNALVQLRQEHEWNNRLEVVKNGEFLRFILTDNTGKEANISMRITDWQPSEIYDVRAVWNETAESGGNGGTIELYVNGQLAGRDAYPGRFEPPARAPLYVGADWRGSNYAGANATLYNFQISNRTSSF